MKLAIINQCASAGGWNYIVLLVKHLKILRPDWQITLFIDKVYSNNFRSALEDLKNIGVEFQHCLSEVTSYKQKRRGFLKRIGLRYKKLKNKIYFNLHKTVFYKQLEAYDALFYSWPYDGATPFNIDKPCFFIPHDFIYTHFFGFHSGNVYNRDYYQLNYESHLKFLQHGEPIVSTPYIAEELKQTFPEYKGRINVVYLSRFNEFTPLSDEQIKSVLSKYGIHNSYLLWSSNWSHHKNMGQIMGAYYQVKQKYPDVKLVVTGFETRGIKAVCKSPYYVNHVRDMESDVWDIITLGEVPSEDFSAILQGASAMINSSLCEAGAGSGLDAWSMGIPMVMSDIPAFKQQTDFLKTKAEFFNPRNADDIAKAILNVLDNPEKARQDGQISQKAMSLYTWNDVARQYADIFIRGCNESKK